MRNSKKEKAERANERIKKRNDEIIDFLIAVAWWVFHIIAILYGLFWIAIITILAVKFVL